MLTKVKSYAKSETMWFALLLTVLGIVEVNLPMMKSDLGVYYPYIFTAIGIVVALLRMTSTKPISEL